MQSYRSPTAMEPGKASEAIDILRMREIVEIRDLATVITNLLSAIPWIGTDLVEFSHLLLISLFILAILPTIGT